MTSFIKYKRFTEDFNNSEAIQEFFDKLITDGWEIIHYYEMPKTHTDLGVIIVAGKRNANNVVANIL